MLFIFISQRHLSSLHVCFLVEECMWFDSHWSDVTFIFVSSFICFCFFYRYLTILQEFYLPNRLDEWNFFGRNWEDTGLLKNIMFGNIDRLFVAKSCIKVEIIQTFQLHWKGQKWWTFFLNSEFSSYSPDFIQEMRTECRTELQSSLEQIELTKRWSSIGESICPLPLLVHRKCSVRGTE